MADEGSVFGQAKLARRYRPYSSVAARTATKPFRQRILLDSKQRMEPSVVRQPRPGGSNPFSAAKFSRTGGSAQILELVPAIGTVRTRSRLGLPGALTQRMDCALHPGQKTVGTVRCARRCSFFLSANRSGQFSTTLRGTVSGARVPGWRFHPGKTTIWIA